MQRFARNWPTIPTPIGQAWCGHSRVARVRTRSSKPLHKPLATFNAKATFFIGLDKFAAGDRASARDYFQKSVATGIFHFLEHRWSRSLLAVMQRHPDWPKK